MARGKAEKQAHGGANLGFVAKLWLAAVTRGYAQDKAGSACMIDGLKPDYILANIHESRTLAALLPKLGSRAVWVKGARN